MWRRRAVRGTVAAALIAVIGTTPPAHSSPRTAAPADPVATVVARYRERIPELMAQQHIPGLAVALVDAERPLWVEGFGSRDDAGAPVTADTIFGVQSMSKVFTATAVMQEVAAGRLDLDAPITTYLPGFTVHSAFQKRPERRITLRMLLSHTAGFALEAPVGNNNDLDPGTFEAHVRSISDTWLRFPVGSGYAYSNLGIDLAGHVLERIEGEPFPTLMRDWLLGPLGMAHSTFDRTVIRSTGNRAVGHVAPYPEPPLDVPMTAAGGLYSSAADLARFLRFELNDGALDGRVALPAKEMHEMRRVPPPDAGAPAGYALGVARTRWNRFSQRPVLFDHGGGGYGFLSDLWWLPQLGLGIAVLTNSQDHTLQGDLALSILGDLVTRPGVFRDRLLRLPDRPPVTDPGSSFQPPPRMATLVARAAMAPDAHQSARWASYTRLYRVPAWGVVSPVGLPDRFGVDAGHAFFDARDDDGPLVRHPLVEVERGVFLADNGDTLDLRGPVPTWGNLRLVPVSGGPSPAQWAILLAAATAAAVWLGTAFGRLRRRRRQSTPPAVGGAASPPRWRWVTAAVATLTALTTLGVVVLMAAVPGLVDSGYLAWLHLPVLVRMVLELPLALAVLGATDAVLVLIGWLGHWWPKHTAWQYAALAVAATTLAVQTAAWGLMG